MEDDRLAGVASGDMNAFHDIFSEYYGQVKQFSYSMLKDMDAAEDIAQEVFMKIWSGRHLLPSVRNFRNWLFQISKNTLTDHIRREVSAMERNSIFAKRLPPNDESFEKEFIAKETRRAMGEIVEKMPEKRREVFILNRFYGKTNDEIAERLQISKKTVENHLHLALKELKEKLPVLVCIFLMQHFFC